jgi:membrane fusion protein, heavy metal efflux system
MKAVHRMAACTLLGLAALLAPGAQAGPGAHGPNGEHLDGAGATTGSGLARLPDGSVQVPKLSQRRMGIRTIAASETEAASTVELPGRVIMDPNAGGRVQAVHGGRLEPGPHGLPVPGQRVRAGEVLAYLRHHAEPIEQANQQAQLAELRANRMIAQQRVQRLESLEGTVPRKDIETARAELQGLLAREKSVAGGIGAREALVAPVSGVIARADAVRGQVVEPRDVLFEVVDPTRVLVEATTADTSLVGKVAAATVRHASGIPLQLVGTARSLRDGVLPLTFRASGAFVTSLAVGQPVTVVAQLQDRVKGVVLPAQAVTRNPANEPVVWIKSGAQRFIPQPVQYRSLDAQSVVVTQGLAPDNRVVVQGAALIAQIR